MQKKWNIDDFPLLVAEYDHLAWIKQVLDTVANPTPQNHYSLTDNELTDHHLCRFGRWYYSHGQARYGHLVEFTALEPIHAEVHRIGTQIMHLHSTGQQAAAQALCQSLLTLKNNIVSLLYALHRAAFTADAAEPLISHDTVDML